MFENIKETMEYAVKNIFHPFRVVCAIGGGLGSAFTRTQTWQEWAINSFLILFGFFMADILSTYCGQRLTRLRCIAILLPVTIVSGILTFVCYSMIVDDLFGSTFGVSLFLLVGACMEPEIILIFSSKYSQFDHD